MIKISCCIPGGSLMPEGVAGVPEGPVGQIVSKCRYLLSVGYDCTECAGGMLAGLWEFPGGKIQEGETMPQCIARELEEEMGLELEVGPELTVVHHAYSHFTIALHAHFARILSGRPRHLECAGHAWVTLDRMDDYPFSKADLKIIEALRARPSPVRFKDIFPGA